VVFLLPNGLARARIQTGPFQAVLQLVAEGIDVGDLLLEQALAQVGQRGVVGVGLDEVVRPRGGLSRAWA
jgi:hypothetical protein